MIAVSCSPRSPVTRHGDHSRWTGEAGLERGSANPELAIALIRQLARIEAGEGGGDQAGRLPGAPAGAAGARSRSTTWSSAPRGAPTSTWIGSWPFATPVTPGPMRHMRVGGSSSSRSAEVVSPSKSSRAPTSGRPARRGEPPLARALGPLRGRGAPSALPGELRAGEPSRRGRRGRAHAYNTKELRAREREIGVQAEAAYQTLVEHWRPQRPAAKKRSTGATKEARH